MHATHLMELARLVGVSQVDIARALGVSEALVSCWASGTRAVSKRLRQPLLALLFTHAKARLLQVRPRSTLAGAYRDPAGYALFRQIGALLQQCIRDTWELEGVGASAAVQATLVALAAYHDMAPSDLRKPVQAARLRALAQTLLEHADVLCTFGELLTLVEDTDDVAGSSTRAVSGADPRDPGD